MECIKIFGDRIENKNIADLLYPDNEEQKLFLTTLLTQILEMSESPQLTPYLSLLPNEIVVKDRNISISYRMIKDTQYEHKSNIMLILTDITNKRYLELQAEAEKRILKMVVRIVTNYKDFIEIVNDYKRFCQYGIYEILESRDTSESKPAEIFKVVHTFKGNFSIFEPVNTCTGLHEVGSRIVELGKNDGTLTDADLTSFFKGLEMDALIDSDLEIINSILGSRFIINDNILNVEKQKQKYIAATLSTEESGPIINRVRKLRYRSFKDLLKSYPEYTLRLSERYDKPINSFEVEGDDIMVDTDRYEKGKSEYGNACCRIKQCGKSISISVSDDGKGIDIENIKLRAFEKGIYSKKELEQMSETKLLHVIFVDRFTTKKNRYRIVRKGYRTLGSKRRAGQIGWNS